MPITLPSWVNSGPPELPWLIGASIWMNWSYGPAPMSRPLRRDDAGGHGAAETERIAHRDHPLARLHVRGIAELDVGQRLVRHRSSAPRCRCAGRVPTTLAGSCVPSSSVTDDRLGVLHHVVVGDDGAVGIDDEAGAARLDGVRLRSHLRAHAAERELAERHRQLRPRPRRRPWLAFSLVVIETTAGFTWVTRSVKSGSVWPVMPLPGGLTGAPGVASVAAKPAWPTAKPPSAVPASRTAAIARAAPQPWCAGSSRWKGSWFLLGKLPGYPGRQAGRAPPTQGKCRVPGERSLGAAIKPLSCRLNLCHSPNRSRIGTDPIFGGCR